MKVDLYTKVILTIIAVSLLLIAVKLFFFEPVQPVYAQDIREVRVDLARVGGWSIYDAIPVKIVNDSIKLKQE